MTKKIMSQNGRDKKENKENTTANTASTETSEYINDTKRESANKTKNENAFFTPVKKIKFHSYIHKTPKKKNRIQEYDDLPIVGKNLINIFESMQIKNLE